MTGQSGVDPRLVALGLAGEPDETASIPREAAAAQAVVEPDGGRPPAPGTLDGQIADAIRRNRTDGAIVRVITQVLPSESVDVARERVIRFTAQMSPNLPSFIPD